LLRSLLRLLPLDALVDLFAVYRYIPGRVYPYAHLISLDSQDSYCNFVTDHQGLANPSG
jgi:hypothetical protein